MVGPDYNLESPSALSLATASLDMAEGAIRPELIGARSSPLGRVHCAFLLLGVYLLQNWQPCLVKLSHCRRTMQRQTRVRYLPQPR